MRLVFKDLPSGGLEASFSWAQRLVFVVIGIILVVAALIPTEDSQGLSPAAMVAIIVLFLASCYEERWRFDPVNQTISFRFGLVFLAKKLRLNFSAVAAVALESFTKGGQKPVVGDTTTLKRFLSPKRFLRLSIRLKDGQELVVETLALDKAAGLRATGQKLSAIFGLEETTELDL